jgi:hypothetical protein
VIRVLRILPVREAVAAGGGDHPVTVHAKMLRLELSKVKGGLERSLGELVPDCSKCGRTVHLGRRLGASVVHWSHREPAPHGEPSV